MKLFLKILLFAVELISAIIDLINNIMSLFQ
ncbi:hypothetical protein PAV_11c00820 [Paenibacillus alvei DSM 29]|nr:hypothetical protein PAV_11c00820 [Paenibacillus alvei DSM 29]